MARRALPVWIAAMVVLVGMTTGAAAVAAAPATHPATASASAGFVPLTPARLLDTRAGAAPGAGSTISLSVVGRGGVPASGVGAVVLNVTAVSPGGPGYLTAYPAGTTRPTASNLNYARGRTVANQVIAKVGAGGRVDLYTSARANLVVDVSGFYRAGTAYTPLTPARLLDTRAGTRPAARSTTAVTVTGLGGVPATGVAAVVLNVTAVAPTGSGYLTVYPAGTARPTASNLNYAQGQTVAGMTIAKVGAGGAVNLYTLASAHLVVDVAGWIPTTSDYATLGPARVLDTRRGLGAVRARVPAGGSRTVQVTGGVRAWGVSAVEVTVTAVHPGTRGYLTAYPAGAARPGTSTVNFTAGRTTANSATVRLGADGAITIRSSEATGLVLDVVGYWREAGAAPVQRYAAADGTAVRSAASTSSRVVARAARGTLLIGHPTGSWLHLTSPYAGRYVQLSSVTTNRPAARTLWAGFADALVKDAPSSTARTVYVWPAETRFTGTLIDGWLQLTSGPLTGRWVLGDYLTTTNPAVPLRRVPGPGPISSPGTTVTRYVLATNYRPIIRASASTSSTAVARVFDRQALTGRYVNRSWFKITGGANRGRYLTAAVLQATTSLSTVDGRVPSVELCPLPAFMQTAWEPRTTRYLQCSARNALVALDGAFHARFGVHLAVDEGYRDLTKQRYFYDLWGYPAAAYPGTSNHGLGNAIDFSYPPPPAKGTGSPYYWGTPVDKWLHVNAVRFGWQRPSYYDSPGSSSEFWHYNFVG